MDFTDDECCTHSDLLDMIFDMSDLNIDQFDVNFGQALVISWPVRVYSNVGIIIIYFTQFSL